MAAASSMETLASVLIKTSKIGK